MMSATMDQVVKRAKDSFGQMFDKNLHDLVRGIRNHKDNEAKYINEAIDEIKHELKQDNMSVKANAINKLIYLQMLGYDISWSAFNIVEVMSSNKFTYKRIGYLAASQCFHDGTDVLMLTTNTIRKDLNSSAMYEASIAMSGLSCFINGDLARDLAQDIMTLMTSTKPYVRRRAILLLYKVFLNNPDALKPAFPRLKEKLEDPDAGVQAAAVNVICELARRNPKNYLGLAPIFFRLMTTSTNNWVLIKIIKLFGVLTPLEPRLGKKLMEPLTNLIHSTSATSLLYECINTVIAVLVSISSGLPNHDASIQLCVQKLRLLIEDSDQNLKYLGLLAMSKILQANPKTVQAHNDLIIRCLDDRDESIRMRALDLLPGMVTRKNLMDVVHKLMVHMDKSEGSLYRDELLSKIINICSQNDYHHIVNFEWYISILVELTRLDGTKHGHLISLQMLDVAVRVESIRSFACNQMAILLENAHVFMQGSNSSNVADVLYAAAWICGEYCSYLHDPQKTLDAMLTTKIAVFPGHIQSVYYQNILKIVTHIVKLLDDDKTRIQQLLSTTIDRMTVFLSTGDVEAQERASVALNIMKTILKLNEKSEFNFNELSTLFDGVLNPVAAKAQRKVALPNGLDLDAWINDPPSESEDESAKINSDNDQRGLFYNTNDAITKSNESYSYQKPKTYTEPTIAELEKQRELRKQTEQNNPFYLKEPRKSKPTQSTEITLNGKPTATEKLGITGLQSNLSDQLYRQAKIDEENRRLKKKSKDNSKSTKKRKQSSNQLEQTTIEDNDEDIYPTVQVKRGGELPEGVIVSDNEDHDNDKRKKFDPHRALNIDFNEKMIPSPSPQSIEKPSEATESIKKIKSKKNDQLSMKKPKRKPKDRVSKDLSPKVVEEQKLSVAEVSNTQEKPKKKKSKEKTPSTKQTDTSTLLLLDMMSDDINLTNHSPQQEHNEQDNYELVARSENLTVEYSIRPSATLAQLDVTFLLKNQTSSIVDHINVQVIDSMSSKLLNTNNTNMISFPSISLFPHSQNYIHVYFVISAISFSQNLKTALTYTLNTTNTIETDRIDFKLHLPCSQYLRHKTIDSIKFADLMSSGVLTCQSQVRISSYGQDLQSIVNKICGLYRLTVVEKVQLAVSLYAESILGHPIALLLKLINSQNDLIIDGKSTETHFLSNLMEELQASLK